MADETKAERLAIGGIAAPALRNARRRPIKAVDAEGKVVRELDSVEFAQGLLRRAKVEFDVEKPFTTMHGICLFCGIPFVRKLVAISGKKTRPDRCLACTRCRGGGHPCAKPGCNGVVALKTLRRATKEGREYLCEKCVKTKSLGPCANCGASAPGGNGFWRKGLCSRCYGNDWCRRNADRRREKRRTSLRPCRKCGKVTNLSLSRQCSTCANAAFQKQIELAKSQKKDRSAGRRR
jgi:hypothetical protein